RGARGDRLLAAGGEPLIAVAHRIYARALFDAARDRGRVAKVREELADLVAALRDVPELAALLDNPEIESHVKASVLDQVLGGGGELREIAAEFEALVAQEERVLDVELTTAHELTDEEFGRILGRIEQASGRKVQATRAVDPGLIGGIVLQAG